MTVEFLHDVLSIDHSIFSKWSGYTKWYLDAITYHAMSPKSRRQRMFFLRKNRNHSSKYDTLSFILKLKFRNGAFRQDVDDANVMWQGYVFSPIIRISKSKDKDQYKVKLFLFLGKADQIKTIDKFYLESDMVYLILPGNQTYNRNRLFCETSSAFLKEHARQSSVKFEMANCVRMQSGTIDGPMLEQARIYGLQFAAAYKSCDYSWPCYMKGILPNLSVLNRKGSTSYALL